MFDRELKIEVLSRPKEIFHKMYGTGIRELVRNNVDIYLYCHSRELNGAYPLLPNLISRMVNEMVELTCVDGENEKTLTIR